MTAILFESGSLLMPLSLSIRAPALLLFSTLLLFADLPAQAADGSDLSVEDMVQQLKSGASEDLGGVPTRALRPGAAAQGTALPVKKPVGGSLSLQVQFDFGSAQLSRSSHSVLQKLAQALASGELSGYSFSVIGHTDGVGSPAYNLSLSKRRAASVKAYLIGQGVPSARIRSDGKGQTELLDPNDPAAAVNRRVEVTATPG
ncbi:OmpA family protein [Azotobacter chroococcum]|uniref:OmpA family protein n=1 Tax=Azotobacter chroococcum TaxID=353 RepID=UPI0010ADE60B|nr:OmpA family protein [Azotobacter chroococcum]TKD47273.1 OmpA family protein [Azotobacter chroococcum]